MNTYQSGFAEINGTKLFYEIKGKGFPLVMLHGNPLDSRMWDPQFEEFSMQFQVIRFDFAGFGQSGVHENDYNLLEDIKGLLDFLEIEKAFIVGLSIGGNISMDFTLAYPKMVEKLILVSTGLLGWTEFSPERQKYHEELNECYQSGDQERVIEKMCKAWVAGPFRSEDEVSRDLRAKYTDMLRSNLAKEKCQGKMILPEEKTIDSAKDITVPTLIITPEVDFPEFIEIANYLKGELKNSQKVILPGTAHMINMEKPNEFNDLVLNFLI